MSARDKIHESVKNALIKDGWTITHDPLRLEYEDTRMEVDLAAEKLIAAERGTEKIAVEIKSLIGRSRLQDFKLLVGQYEVYDTLIQEIAPVYNLLIAVEEEKYRVDFAHPIIRLRLAQRPIPFVLIDIESEEVREWIN